MNQKLSEIRIGRFSNVPKRSALKRPIVIGSADKENDMKMSSNDSINGSPVKKMPFLME